MNCRDPGKGRPVRSIIMRAATGLDLRRLSALAEIRAALGVTGLVPLAGGGSTAQVWRAVSAAGEPVVIKYLDGAAGRVDGHDLPTFTRKPRQIRRVHAELPALSPYYVRLAGEWHARHWAAYAMPYVAGRGISALLRGPRPDVPGFLRELRGVLGVLTEHGYAAASCPAPAGHLADLHASRVRRRLPLLRAHLDPALFGRDGVVVNGRRLPPLDCLLARLDERAAALEPGLLHYPVHGDLNLGNIVLHPGTPAAGFTLLDPRGTADFWDASYDIAKIMFSLTVYEPAMDGGFAVAREPGWPARYRVALRRPRPACAAAAAGLPGILGSLPFFTGLDQADPGWRQRLAIAHAVHALAEAACRLSDRRPRDLGPVRGWAACRELALGLFLTGLTELDDVLARPVSATTVPATTGLAS